MWKKLWKTYKNTIFWTEGFYADVYSTIDGIGHWKTLEGGNPFDGEVGKSSVANEKLWNLEWKKIVFL